jgi:hypothetical protein
MRLGSGGKLCKERLAVFLCDFMSGEMEKPFVIGKTANPQEAVRSVKERQELAVQWNDSDMLSLISQAKFLRKFRRPRV